MGTFDGPLTTARTKLEAVQDRLREQLRNEPWPSAAPKRRLLRGTVMVETDEHRQWREMLAASRDNAEALEKEISEIIDRVAAEPTTLGIEKLSQTA